MNVLSLVDPKDAWFANAAPAIASGARSGGAGDDAEMDEDEADGGGERSQGVKRPYDSIFDDEARQKTADGLGRVSNGRSTRSQPTTTSYIPAEEFHPDAREIETLRLTDIKREYQLLLARLDLAKGFAELAAPRSTLGARDAVALYLRSDRHDKAIEAARALGVDMSGIFQNLASKATALSLRERAAKAQLLQQRQEAVAQRLKDTEQRSKQASEMDKDGDEDEEEDDESEEVHPSLLALRQEMDLQEDPDAAFLLNSERCASWSGSAAEKAWRYLQLQLDMASPAPDSAGGHSDSSDATAVGAVSTTGTLTSFQYRLCVLKRVLELGGAGSDADPLGDDEEGAAGGNNVLPEWLVEWFEENKPDLLIRAYMSAGLIQRALKAALKLSQRVSRWAVLRSGVTVCSVGGARLTRLKRFATPQPVNNKTFAASSSSSSSSAAPFVPYTLIDELILLAEDPSSFSTSTNTGGSSNAVQLRRLAADLAASVRARTEGVERVERQRRLESQRKLQQQQQQQQRGQGKAQGFSFGNV